ncbi:MAG TPA: response regulator, partial [Gemmataceae bacterium]|nr:response regulator [Gemmataceae bacterium]
RDRLAGPDIDVTAVAAGPAAVRALAGRPADCLVLGPGASDVTDDLLASVPQSNGLQTRLPILVYTDGDLTAQDNGEKWRRLADVCTVRRVHSADLLLDQATSLLHRRLATLPDGQRQQLLDLEQGDRLLAGRKVLIVDDDMRNIFALSTILEEHDMAIVSADNGRDAIRILRDDPGVDIVLMDIMMPEMDGMATMREIRKVPELKNLPIVAVTAKAMKGDREKCIEAGAWDYLSKPVETQQLLAVLRAWLRR